MKRDALTKKTHLRHIKTNRNKGCEKDNIKREKNGNGKATTKKT